jgi:poly(A) polymerase
MLNELLFPETESIFAALGEDNTRFVGGCVRDLVVGSPIKDIDFATKHTPEQVVYHLKKAGIQVIPTGIKHGTITAYFGTKQFEVTTLRRDINTDGRHAEVSYVDEWEIDAARRDFTINALYLSKSGKVLDFFGGIDHLRAGKILFIGDPDQRIREDYLRILRFFRFYARFGQGAPDEAAARACSRHSAQVNYLSGERIQAEMFKILELNNCPTVLQHMQNYGVLHFIFPGDVSFESLKKLLEINPDAPILRRLSAIEGYNLQILAEH